MGLINGSTIYDVAEAAKVSIATISRFLNSPEKVSPTTALRIKKAMADLAYVPHGNAGRSDQRKTGRIGVLTPFFPAPSFMQRLAGMMPVLRAANYELVIYAVDSPQQLDEHLHSIPLTKKLDGLVILAMQLSESATQRLLDSNLQVVLVEQQSQVFSSIECDNVQGGVLAARYLAEKGYLPCAFIGERATPPYSLQPSNLRWEGFQKELVALGKPVPPEHIRLGTLDAADGRRMALELLDQPQRPRGIFAMCDLQAIGALKAARELGLQVPGDVAILGFDDIESAAHVELSTVSQELEESGRLAAEVLLARIEDPQRPTQHVQIKVSIVERKTA